MSSPKDVGNDFYDSLSSLTLNSRPIIESLTNLAQENTDAATEIAKAVEKRIQKAIPQHKLFAFYLLDSISKNVGAPYNTIFGSNIFKLFAQAYSLVDDPTRVKLIKLFRTWKVPNQATGLPLFDEDQIDQIDRFLVRATAANRPAQGPNQQQRPQPANIKADKPTLLREIDELTNLVNSRLLQMPDDQKGRERFQLLQKLRTIIGAPSSIPQQQLDYTKKQLQSIREDEVMRLNQFKQQHVPQLSTNQLQGLLSGRPQQSANGNGNGNGNGLNPQAAQLFNMMSQMMRQQQQQQQQRPNGLPQKPQHGLPQRPQVQSNRQASTPPPGVASGANSNPLGLKNIGFLQDILRKSKAGENLPQLSGVHDAVGSGGVRGESRGRAVKKSGFNDPPEVIITRFELGPMISSHQPTEEEVGLLYELKPNQCSNCSKRFYNTPEGAREKEQHLDWHFRTNKKLKTTSKQIHNRAWYMSDQQWVAFHEDEITGGNDTVAVEQLNNRREELKPKMTQAELDQMVVPIPEDSENEVVCGICRDKLVGVFDDDTGEWVWRNATRQRGRVYHYSCWVETKGDNRDRSPERR